MTNPAAPDDGYRYVAFISYRHVEPDRKWARWLHKALETYRVPRQLRQACGLPTRLGRVFRDEEELSASTDLSKDIEEALGQSKFLVVVCSPRTPPSKWVNEEVVRFREMGRGDRVLALLIEGEPSESFPGSLRDIRQRTVEVDGQTREEIEETEPLAADVRAASNEHTGHLRQTAVLRLASRVLDCEFDDLRRRDQERRMKRLAWLSGGALLLAAAMAGLVLWAYSERNRANLTAEVAEARRVEAVRARTDERQACVAAEGARAQAQRERDLKAEALEGRERALTTAVQERDAKAAALEAERDARREVSKQRARLLLELGRSEMQSGHPGRAAAFLAAAYERGEDSPLLQVLLNKAIQPLLAAGCTFHKDEVPVVCVTFSADCTRVATGCAGGVIRVWSNPKGNMLKELRHGEGDIIAVSFDSDDRRLMAASTDGQVSAWHTANWAVQARWTTEEDAGRVSVVRIDPVSLRVVVVSDTSVSILDTLSLRRIARCDLRDVSGVTSVFSNAAIHQQAGHLATISCDGRVHIWDATTGKHIQELASPLPCPVSRRDPVPMALDSASGYLACAGVSSGVVLWDLNSREILKVLQTSGYANCVALSGGGEGLAVGTTDGRLVLASASGWWNERRVQTQRAELMGLAFSHDGALVASTSSDGSLDVWTARAGHRIGSYRGTSGPSTQAAWGRASRLLLAGYQAGPAQAWSVPESAALAERTYDHGSGTFRFTRDGTRILYACGRFLGSEDPPRRNAELLDASSGQVATTFSEGGGTFTLEAVLSPQEDRVLTLSSDKRLRLWRFPDGELVRDLGECTEGLHPQAFRYDGKYLVAVGGAGFVGVWRCVDAIQTHGIQLESEPDILAARSAYFSAHEDDILTVHTGQLTRLWRVLERRETEIASWHASRGGLSPDGHRLLRWRETEPKVHPDGMWEAQWQLELWNTESGELVQVLDRGPRERVHHCPEGLRAVTCPGQYGTCKGAELRLWDTMNGRLVGSLAHDKDAWARLLGFTPDGAYAITLEADHELRLWCTETGQAHALLEGWFGHSPVLAFDVHRKRMAAIDISGWIRTWNWPTAAPELTVSSRTRNARCAAFSSDGALLLVGDGQGDVHVLEASTGRFALTIGVGGRVCDVDVSPNGERVIVYACDNNSSDFVQLWDLTRERATPEVVNDLVERKCRWRLDGAHLVPKPLK